MTKPTKAYRRRSTPSRDQALHLIDLENLVGGSAATSTEVAAAIAAYRSSVPVGPTDHVVIGTGPTLAPRAVFAWPSARLVVGHGLDGADRALIDWVWNPNHIATRYSALYIASGDGIFARLAWEMQNRGLPTTVVARHGVLSRSLQSSGSRSLFLSNVAALAA